MTRSGVGSVIGSRCFVSRAVRRCAEAGFRNMQHHNVLSVMISDPAFSLVNTHIMQEDYSHILSHCNLHVSVKSFLHSFPAGSSSCASGPLLPAGSWEPL